MQLTEAQDIVFAAVVRGEVKFTPPPYTMGAGHFVTDEGRIPTNSTLVIALARRLQEQEATAHEPR